MSHDDPSLPPKLAEALRSAYGHRLDIPAEVERALLARAAAKFALRRRARRIVSWGAGAAAAVAACIVLAMLLLPARVKLVPGKPVDMVDAMLLARQLNGRQAIDPSWDFNHDGRIDPADVEAIARAAVALNPRAPQANVPGRPALPALPGLPGLDQLGLGSATATRARHVDGPIASLHALEEAPQ